MTKSRFNKATDSSAQSMASAHSRPIRAPRTQRKATAVHAAQPDQVFAAATETYMEALGVPSMKRLLVAFVAQVAVGVGCAQFTLAITNVVATAAIVMTGSMFAGLVVFILGLITAIVTAWMAGNWTFKFVADFKVAPVRGRIVDISSRAFNRTRSLFTFGGQHA